MNANEKVLLSRTFKKDGELVKAELTHLKGSERPYFSVTTDAGCAHDTIREVFAGTEVMADLDLLMSLHLADDEGVPMHAVANASYYVHNLLGISEHPQQTTVEQLAQHLRTVVNDATALLVIARTSTTTESAVDKRTVATAAVHSVVDQLRPTWKEQAERAKAILAEPDWQADEPEHDPKTEWLLQIDGDDTYEVTDHYEHRLPSLSCGRTRSYAVVQAREDAEAAVVEYWTELKDTDPREFRELIGDETLIAWACGQSAGPGNLKAKGFNDWLDSVKAYPEEQFAGYDGEENTGKVSAALAEELGWDVEDGAEWVECLVYREN